MAKRLEEARTREGMRALVVWLPEELHRALALTRVRDSIAMNEAMRQAVKLWLSRRAARRRGQQWQSNTRAARKGRRRTRSVSE